MDWLRQESRKKNLERKLEGTSDPYPEREKDFGKKCGIKNAFAFDDDFERVGYMVR